MKALSGGERNRLLLARLLTKPANVLVLDEPTNDLDIETLELLEAQLVAFPGALLIVSHDRRFLDNVVTSTFVFEGVGRVEEYVGGYADWIAQRAMSAAVGASVAPRQDTNSTSTPRDSNAPARREKPRTRLSYHEQRELEALPARIAALERELTDVQARIAAPEFYKEPAAAIAEALQRVEAIGLELDAVYQRWDELDSRAR